MYLGAPRGWKRCGATAPDLTRWADDQHPHRPGADGIDLERLQHAAVDIDSIGGEPARFESGGKEELPPGIETESTRDGFGWRMRHRRQEPCGGVDGKTGDTVVAAVWRIQK